MKNKAFINDIIQLIEKNDIEEAFSKLKPVFENSPKLTNVIMLSSRYNDIMDQITTGTVNFENASITKNQIKHGLLKMLDEIKEIQIAQPEIGQELEQAISIVNSKNVVSGSSISAGGSVNIGDQNQGTDSAKSPPKIEPAKNNNLIYILSFLAFVAVLILIWFLVKT